MYPESGDAVETRSQSAVVNIVPVGRLQLGLVLMVCEFVRRSPLYALRPLLIHHVLLSIRFSIGQLE